MSYGLHQMKHFRIFKLCFGLLLYANLASAQDGFFNSAPPPVIIRFADGKAHFTNSSDKVLHGITMHSQDSEGKKSSKVIIDTIEPHKTVALKFLDDTTATIVRLLFDKTTITCEGYSKPIPTNPDN
jgi:hypothetical protein